MRIVIFGSAGSGIMALEASERARQRVSLVVAPAGDELAAVARKRALAVAESPDLRSASFEETLREAEPGVIVAAGYPDPVPLRFLHGTSRIGIAFHPSLLPTYRGETPIAWAIVNGERRTGATLHRISAKAYEGDILAQSTVEIEPDDREDDVKRRVLERAEDLLCGLLGSLDRGEGMAPLPQDASAITVFPPLRRRDALIKFDEPTRNVHDRIRATTPAPGAHTFYGDREIRILRSETLSEPSYEVAPGLVMRSEGSSVVVKTADGAIRIETDPSLADEAREGHLVTLDDGGSPLGIKRTASGKIVHTPDRYGMVVGAEEFPKMVVLATVYPCNAVCPNCPYTETNSDIRRKYADAPYMEAELFRKIADECGRFGSFVRITGGGEPMMHPQDMVGFIEYAKRVGARAWLNTNGSLLPREKIDRLLDCGLDQVEFSVDAADRETYRVVRAGLDWDNLVETVGYFVAERNRRKSKTNVVVSVIEQELVKDRMEEIVRFWLERGVDEVMRRKFLTWGSNTNIDAGFSGDPTPYLDKTAGEPCPYPFHRLNIDSRGKVEVCGYDISGRTNFGNVRTQSIQEIWKGPMFEWWRATHLERRGGEIPLCRECPDWQYRSWTHNWEKVMRTAEKHRLHAIELTDVSARNLDV